jgi:hypothetical protein
MDEKIISLNDKHSIRDIVTNKDLTDRLGGKVKKTKITITDHDTGEVLGEYENKVVISGSMFSGCRIFGIDSSLILPTYNDEMHFDKDQEKLLNYDSSIVQLFCVGDDGCGSTQRDVYPVNYTDRIKPLTDLDNIELGCIYPFRFQNADDDLPEQLRSYYFGRKTYSDKNKIAYYFKKFDTTPELHVMYADGTQVDDNMYNSDTDQIAECYVETRLRITRNDLRDFFEQMIGWENARISTLSLCYAWEFEDPVTGYKFYQDIYPYTKLNFPVEFLVNLDKAIDFNYQVYY